jgi:GNAT superfamily N-acetyltransferase
MISPPERIDVSHDIREFNSGKPELDSWLKSHALRAERERTATTYILADDNRVFGYYSLAAHSVERGTIGGGRLARNAPDPVPALLLARLAVDTAWQGKGIGADLLAHAMNTTQTVGALIGLRAIIVDPIDDRAKAFYSRYGFREFPALPSRMFYPL